MSSKRSIKTDIDDEENEDEDIFYEDDNIDNPANKRLKIAVKPTIRGFKPSSTIPQTRQKPILSFFEIVQYIQNSSLNLSHILKEN